MPQRGPPPPKGCSVTSLLAAECQFLSIVHNLLRTRAGKRMGRGTCKGCSRDPKGWGEACMKDAGWDPARDGENRAQRMLRGTRNGEKHTQGMCPGDLIATPYLQQSLQGKAAALLCIITHQLLPAQQGPVPLKELLVCPPAGVHRGDQRVPQPGGPPWCWGNGGAPGGVTSSTDPDGLQHSASSQLLHCSPGVKAGAEMKGLPHLGTSWGCTCGVMRNAAQRDGTAPRAPSPAALTRRAACCRWV